MRTFKMCAVICLGIIICGCSNNGREKQAPPPAKAPVVKEEIFDVTALEGKWKVVSSTWGGDNADFKGVAYNIKIVKNVEDVKTSEGFEPLTLFTASIKSERLETADETMWIDPSSIDAQFCVMRYSELKNTYKFMNGISYFPENLGFDKNDCMSSADEENEKTNESEITENDDEIAIGRNKSLIRIDLLSPSKAHAIAYYEISVTSVASREAVKKERESNNPVGAVVCKDDTCLMDATMFFGVFELELEKTPDGEGVDSADKTDKDK